MKRDLDLARSILLQAEGASGPVEVGDLEWCGRSHDEVCWHVELMRERGLLDATVKRSQGGAVVLARIDGITWEGCDYLDSVRDERVWAKAKGAIRDSVGTATFDVVKAVCSKIAEAAALAAVGL